MNWLPLPSGKTINLAHVQLIDKETENHDSGRPGRSVYLTDGRLWFDREDAQAIYECVYRAYRRESRQ